MADNNQQVEEPVLEERARNAQKEFNVILDVLLVPLRSDISNQKLPPRRRWRGGCLLELQDPDLVPDNPNPQAGLEGFCSRVEEGPDAGKLRVRVKNQGAATAPPSTTMVEFSPGGSFPLTTPEILAGEVVELPLSMPADCVDSECEIKITVDSNNQVVESDENNNTISVTCGGGVD
jgi:hypothetical protein